MDEHIFPCARGAVSLQWGRGGLPADGRVRRLSMSRVCPPSMGPRGFARGWMPRLSHARKTVSSFNGAAGVCPRMGRHGLQRRGETRVVPSMGPRGFARGWIRRLKRAACLSASLQWGRGGLPADGVSASWRTGCAAILQWGRGGLPADGRTHEHQRSS